MSSPDNSRVRILPRENSRDVLDASTFSKPDGTTTHQGPQGLPHTNSLDVVVVEETVATGELYHEVGGEG